MKSGNNSIDLVVWGITQKHFSSAMRYNGSMVEKRSGGIRHIADLIRERNIILNGADALSRQGFTQVPNSVPKSDKLWPGAKLAYTMLLSYAWQNDYCFPGQERLAKDMGSGLRSVVRYIQELEKGMFVKITKRGLGRPNLYELNLTVRDAKRKEVDEG